MATAGAIIGLGGRGRGDRDVATTAKTLPDFPALWTGMLGAVGGPPCAATASTPTRTTSAARPNRKGTRPRTNIRPKHEDAVEGMVLTVDRGRLTCLVDDRIVTAMKARELGRKAAVVGDRVAIVGDLSGEKDTLARIVRIERAHLGAAPHGRRRRPVRAGGRRQRRPAGDRHRAGRPGAPPAADRPLSGRGVRRRARPAAGPDQVGPGAAGQLLELYGALGVPYVVTSREELGDGAAADGCASSWTAGSRRSSGTPASARRRWSTRWSRGPAAGDRRRQRGDRPRPAHHDLRARPAAAAAGGWVIDTPGVRSFGLHHVDPSRVILAFPDLVPGTEDCPRACSHDEPDCALDAWVAEGHADPARLYSLRRLLSTRERREGD